MGYGLEDNYKFTDKPEKIDFEAYKEFLGYQIFGSYLWRPQ